MSVCRVVLVFLLFPAAISAAELHTLKGEKIAGDVVAISNKEIVISKGTDRVTTPLSQVLQLDYNPLPRPGTDVFADVELTDGTLLHCSKYSIKSKDIELTLLAGPQITVPLAVVGNVLTEASNEKYRREWSERLADRKARMKRRDVLAVRKEGVLNALEGTLGDGDEKGETIDFTTGTGRKRAVPASGIAGLVFERGVNPDAAPVICRITDISRDSIQASSLVLSSNELTITTPAGVKIGLKPEALVRLDFSGGKVVWLSDLEPILVVENLLEGNNAHVLKDRSQDGPIRLGNQIFSRGLSVHADTELEYDLRGDYREFKAVVGINDAWLGVDSPTVLRIEGDGKLLKQLSFDRRDKVRHAEVKLNVKDVQKLKIVVSDGDKRVRWGNGKLLDLGDAKVSK